MTLPGRDTLRLRVKQVKRLLRPRGVILLYHRIAALRTDPQLLCVSPANFREHLDVIRRFGDPVRLDELDGALRRTPGGSAPIVLTFDDGYADNLLTAKPLLERAGVPATVFVATGPLTSRREFWQDDLERVFLQQPVAIPRELHLAINGRTRSWSVAAPANHAGAAAAWDSWNVESANTPTWRHEMYRSVFASLLPLTPTERQTIVDRILEWAALEQTPRQTHRTLTADEVVQLGRGALVEVGAHTVNHPVLSTLSEADQAAEILESRQHLEAVLGREVSSFAYPYGTPADYTLQTVAAVRRAGFRRACANVSGLVGRGTDQWQLPRILVRNWTGDELARRMTEWLG